MSYFLFNPSGVRLTFSLTAGFNPWLLLFNPYGIFIHTSSITLPGQAGTKQIF